MYELAWATAPVITQPDCTLSKLPAGKCLGQCAPNTKAQHLVF